MPASSTTPTAARRGAAGFVLILASMVLFNGGTFLFKVLLTRFHGPEAMAIFTLCWILTVFLGVAADLGLRQTLVSLLSTDADPASSPFWPSGVLLKCVVVGCVVVCGWGLRSWVAASVFQKPVLEPYLSMVLLGLIGWNLVELLETWLQSRHAFSSVAAVRVLSEAIRVGVVVFLLLSGRTGVFFSIGVYLLMPLLTTSAALWWFGVPLSSAGAGLGEVRELVRLGKWNGTYRVLTMLLVYLDSLMLPRYGDLSNMGLYEAAKSLAVLVVLMNEALGYVLLPLMASGRLGVWPWARTAGLGLAFCAASAAFVFFGPLGLTIFGSRVNQPLTVDCFRLLATGYLLSVVSSVASSYWIAARRPDIPSAIVLLQTLIGVLVYPMALLSRGLIGAAQVNCALNLIGAVCFAVIGGLAQRLRATTSSEPPKGS